ncbi:MAG: DUF4255 domain-containing protein [Deltaproteobacteria bacterium]
MSNSYAIAAATATLHDILVRVRTPLPNDPSSDPDLAETVISAKPLDKARDPEGKNQLNIFLYHLVTDAQLRNTPAFGTGNGETARQPPVALRLYYMITAYGSKDEDTLAHRLLGRAMSLLQDRAVFMPADIQAALPGNDLYRQVERVRIVPHTITTEELSKLWTTFQTNYRVSTAYEVSVVLIDSTQTRTTPLPVLRRGPLDDGVAVFPSTLPPYPTLSEIRLPARQPGARIESGGLPGDVLTLIGNNLAGATVNIRLTNRWLTAPFVLTPLADPTASQVQIQLPDNQTDLPAGIYTVSIGVTNPGDSERISNTLAFPLVPRLLPLASHAVATDASGNATISLHVSPDAWPDQPVSLLVGDREYRANPRTTVTNSLTFALKPAVIGDHFLRVRVDGVDSFVIADYTATPLVFDPDVKVTIS